MQQRLKELFDLVDGHKFKRKRSMRGQKAGVIAGCMGTDGYWRIRIDGKLYLTHRLIWAWHHGELPESELDHIDGDTSNNNIENLRLCNRSQNSSNTKHRKNNTSGYKGVTWAPTSKKWSARIWLNNKCIYLGVYDTKEQAFEAYCNAATNLHQKFAKPTSNP